MVQRKVIARDPNDGSRQFESGIGADIGGIKAQHGSDEDSCSQGCSHLAFVVFWHCCAGI
jgi:hypothetical protein